MSRKFDIVISILILMVCLCIFISCDTTKPDVYEVKSDGDIMMATQGKGVNLELKGEGDVMIVWGDGTTVNSHFKDEQHSKYFINYYDNE